MMNMFYRLIILVLLIIGLSLFHTSAYAEVIVCNTMVGNNSTDNSNALNACMTAAASEPEKIVNIPSASGSYFKLSRSVTIPAEVSLVGATGAAFNTYAPLILSNYSKVIGINFKGGVQRAIITPENGTKVTGAQILNSAFGDSGWATILIYNGDDIIMDNNTFTNANPYQNIEFLSGKRNIITNNYIRGGKTAIIFKYDRIASGGGYQSMFTDNLIMGNDVRTSSYGSGGEEGISFDNGNDTNGTGAIDYDTVAAVDGTSVTLSDGAWGTEDYSGYYLVPITGSAVGQYRSISTMTGASVTVASAFTGLSPGDGVSIQVVHTGNVIAYNTVYSPFEYANAVFSGGYWYCRIEHNTLTKGPGSKGLDNLPLSDLNVTGNKGRLPNGYNIIRENTASDATPIIDGQVGIFASTLTGGYARYYEQGQVAINNTGTGIKLSYQNDYWYDNNGTKDLNNMGSETATALDTTDQSCTDYGLDCVADDPNAVAHVAALDSTCAGSSICAKAPSGQTYTDDGNGSAQLDPPLDPPGGLRIITN